MKDERTDGGTAGNVVASKRLMPLLKDYPTDHRSIYLAHPGVGALFWKGTQGKRWVPPDPGVGAQERSKQHY